MQSATQKSHPCQVLNTNYTMSLCAHHFLWRLYMILIIIGSTMFMYMSSADRDLIMAIFIHVHSTLLSSHARVYTNSNYSY